MSRLIACGLIVVSGFIAVFALGALKPSAASPAAGEKPGPPVVRSAECRWATGPIKIDGSLDEPAWQNAEVFKDFAAYWLHRPAKTGTKARLLWDDNYLYFAAEMEDSDLYADVVQRNGMTWTNDVFELFFKPSVKKLAYYEFQVNAANTPLELFFPSRGSGGYQRFAPLTRFGMESAVKLDGTLNNPADQDKGWTVEGRIPLSAFLSSGDKPRPGAKWRFALCRYDYSVAFEQVETSSTARLTEPDFHRYEDYGELTFVGR
jgi:hypothetical protein